MHKPNNPRATVIPDMDGGEFYKITLYANIPPSKGSADRSLRYKLLRRQRGKPKKLWHTGSQHPDDIQAEH